MTIIANGRRFDLRKYELEDDFERDIVESSKLLFGEPTIYIDAKKRIDSKTLGAAVPDGFLFDFADATDPQFYIVEVELAKHGFYAHIFPQITKFFAFFNSTRIRKSLADKLFSIVDSDVQLRAELKKRLGDAEIYKFLTDIVESSQNILLVCDGSIDELPEIMDTYTDTWGRMVKFLEVKKYAGGEDTVYSVTPDIETLQYAEGEEDSAEEGPEPAGGPYTEDFHLKGAGQNVQDVYARIKNAANKIDPLLIFNPQRYYISIKAAKNIAFIKFRKKKIRFIPMLPEPRIRKVVRGHNVVSLSQAVQDFYNGPCAAVDILAADNFEEIESLIREVVASRHRDS